MPKSFKQSDLADAFYLILGGRKDVGEKAEKLAQLSLQGLCRKALVDQGAKQFKRFPVKADEQIDDASMNEYESRGAYAVIRASMGAGFIAASAFSEALEKTMLDFYEESTPNWQHWANSCEVNRLSGERIDFDPVNTPPVLGSVTPFPNATETNKTNSQIDLQKRGRILKVSFEALLSNDVGVIQRLLREEVAAMIRAEDDDVIAALTGTSGFFTTKNTVTSAPLTESHLDSVLGKLRLMKNSDIKMHYQPSMLLVPTSLAMTASKILEETGIDLNIHVESRLDDVSVQDWYLVANKKQSDSIVLQFLTGRRPPELFRLPRKLDFDGDRYRIKHLCQAKATRPYSIVKGQA